MLAWSEDDQAMETLANIINDIETVDDYYSLATNTLHFVQALIPYVHDVKDYWQLPLQTLYRQEGDCEDGAILYVSLMTALNYPVYFGVYPGHAFTFVEVSKDWVEWAENKPNKCIALGAWEIGRKDNKYYAMAETAIDPEHLLQTLGYWGLGCGNIPDEYYEQGKVRIFNVRTGVEVTSEFELLTSAKGD